MAKKETKAEEVKKDHISGAEAVAVYNKDGEFVREYSREAHGEDFVKLAEGFAGAEKNKRFGYSVRKAR